MTREHLSTDRLRALLRDDIGDFAALEHLATCSDCRRAFDDTRWMLLLSRLPGLIAAGPHPGADELLAYHTYALASGRVAEIRQHLRSCESCMARAGRARNTERSLRYMSPRSLTVSSTMKRFRSRPLRRLGTVVVALIGKALQLTYVPEPAVAGDTTVGQSPEVREIRFPVHPSSAQGRARRLLKKTQEPPDEATLETPSESSSGTVHEPLYSLASLDLSDIGDSMSILSDAVPVESLRVPADGFELILIPRSGPDQGRLDVRIASPGGESVDGIRIHLRGASGPGADGVTDDEGRTSLRLDRDATDLIVEFDPPLAIRMRYR